jgi:hypothetical protein
MAVIETDAALGEEVVSALRAFEQVISAKQIEL